MKTMLITVSVLLTLAAGVASANHAFFIRGAQLTKHADGSWSGPGNLDGVTGNLTITGHIVLLKNEPHTIRFEWVAGKRLVAGCLVEGVGTRPHDVQLWYGSGRITQTSAPERTYQGVYVNTGGATERTDLKRVKISIRSFGQGVPKRLRAHHC
jgi:hypothetical protein